MKLKDILKLWLLLYREVKGILFYQGFPRPIVSSKHPERMRGMFCKQNWSIEGTRMVNPKPAKLVQSVSLCHRLSKKLNLIKIWQVKVGQNKDLVCYRQKQSFRHCAWGLRQLVLKPGFRPKGRALGMKEKSENFNSLRPILFELCKNNYRGGQSVSL